MTIQYPVLKKIVTVSCLSKSNVPMITDLSHPARYLGILDTSFNLPPAVLLMCTKFQKRYLSG